MFLFFDRLDRSLIGSFENQGCQNAASKSAGIEANPVTLDLYLVKNGMSMNDCLGERALVPQKPLANPKQVAALLLIQRQLGIDPSMNKNIISRFDHLFKAGDEFPCCLRNYLG